MFCNYSTRNQSVNNNSNNGRGRTVCLYIISTTIVSIIVFNIALSYNKSLTRLGGLETDVKEILQVLSHMNSNTNNEKHIKEKDTCGSRSIQPSPCGKCSPSIIEETVKKHTKQLHNEIIATKKQIDALKDIYKCGDNTKPTEAAPINYALESLGAKIEYVQDIPYYTDNPILTYMGFHFSNSPRQILCESTSPGNCYAFRGTESTVVINLMRTVHIDSVSIEHILDTMTPSGDISNAPKDFEVYGIKTLKCSEEDEILFGKFTYNIKNREAIQYFKTNSETQHNSFTYIKFKFLTNNGQINYTCIYRVGIHGRLGKSKDDNK